jgi:apolipoprotein N-acyltransferase
VIAGAQRITSGGVTNSAALVVPRAGLIESYAKQRLVPFAEAEPAWGAALRPLFASVANRAPYQAGSEAVVFRRLRVPVAAPICFEITYPGLTRSFVTSGARVLFNLSNDAWFGRTGYAEMHGAHAIFRAIELRTPVARAANTGISALIDARGHVVASLGVGARGAIHGELRANAAPTLYARYGDVPALALMAAGLAAAFAMRRWP